MPRSSAITTKRSPRAETEKNGGVGDARPARVRQAGDRVVLNAEWRQASPRYRNARIAIVSDRRARYRNGRRAEAKPGDIPATWPRLAVCRREACVQRLRRNRRSAGSTALSVVGRGAVDLQ